MGEVVMERKGKWRRERDLGWKEKEG